MAKNDVMPGDRARFVWPLPSILKGAEGRVMRYETGTNDVIWVPDDYALHPLTLRKSMLDVLPVKFDGYACAVDMLEATGCRREYVVGWGKK